MITGLTACNLKNSGDIDIELKNVTVVVGPNRSTKSSVIEALALAATGRSSLGGSRSQAKLLARGKSSAFARAFLANSITCGWAMKKNIDKYTCDHAINNSSGSELDSAPLFGDFLYIDDFWKLTGEQKWTAMGKIISGNVPDEEQAIIKELASLAGVTLTSDCLSDLTLIADKLAGQVKSLKAKQQSVKSALVPPEEYTGESIGVLYPRKHDIDTFILNQRTARTNLADRQKKKLANEQALKDLRWSLSKQQTALCVAQAKVASAENVCESIAPLAESIRSAIEEDNSITVLCRSKPIRTVMQELMESTAAKLAEANLVIANHVSNFSMTLQFVSCAAMLRETSFDLGVCSDSIDSKILPPDEVLEIDRLLSTSVIGWRPNELKAYANAETYVREETNCLMGMVHRIEEGISQINRDIDRISTDTEIDLAKYGSACTDQDFSKALTEQESLAKQINAATEWTTFLDRQKKAIKQLDFLDVEINTTQESEAKARHFRKTILASSVTPIELAANQILSKMNGLDEDEEGFAPLKIKVECTDKRSSMTIETIHGVDFSTMAGSEKIIYGTALIVAMQQLSPATSPLALIEAAELDDNSLTDLIYALSATVIKGNVVVAHWCTPLDAPESVAIVDRLVAKEQ